MAKEDLQEEFENNNAEEETTVDRIFKNLFNIVAIITAILHIAAFTITPLKSGVLYALHLLCGLSLIYLSSGMKNRKTRFLDIIFIILSVVMTVYIIKDYDAFAMRIQVFPSNVDMIMGIIATVLVLEATRRTAGWGLTIIAIVSIIYSFIGYKLPGVLAHRGYDLKRVFSTIFSEQGIYGTAIGVSATNVFLFILFAGFLSASGADKIFQDLAIALAGDKRGGPAKIAVLSSALFGSISGSAVANVVSTGAFTIPLMKEQGYKPKFAGAVEAVASTGGQIMPPIMGAAAFILSDSAGIPYDKVCIAALIPALMYYFTLFIMVDIESIIDDVTGLDPEDIPDVKEVAKKGIGLFIPLGVLLFFLIIVKSTPMKAAIYAIASILIISIFNKENRLSFKMIVDAAVSAARSSLQVIAACAASGIVVGMLSLTGLGLKLSNIIIGLGGGNLIPSLIAAMFVSMILGMGLPTTAAYIIAATSVAPALIKLGIPALAAHLFILYYAAISAITPPVAVASYAAAGLAGENAMKVGWEAVRLGIVAFIVPFAFVLNQKLLVVITGLDLVVLVDLFFALFTCLALAYSLQGWLYRKINMLQRIVIFALGIIMLSSNNWLCLAAGIVFLGLYLFNKKAVEREDLAQI